VNSITRRRALDIAQRKSAVGEEIDGASSDVAIWEEEVIANDLQIIFAC
jgi:hypothetical protein